MKILITGGAGFIGSHLADRFLQDDHEVVVVDNLATGNLKYIESGVRFHSCSILESYTLDDIIRRENPEIVSHLAAQTGVRTSTGDMAWDAQVNIIGSLNVIQSCVNHGVGKLIYSSSGGAGYGKAVDLPSPEGHRRLPISAYGVSKYTCELYLNVAKEIHGLDSTVLRYANVYGPRQKQCGITALFVEACLNSTRPIIFGDGTATRDYVFVSDVVEANAAVLEKGRNEAYNIGTGKETSLLELFGICKKLTNTGDDLTPRFKDSNPEEPDRMALDASKAKIELGWEAQVGVEEGMAHVVKEMMDSSEVSKWEAAEWLKKHHA